MNNNPQIKCAVIGVGHMGQFHVDKFSQIPEAELIAICDPDEQKTKTLALQHNTKAYNDYKEILNQVDAVCIATPTVHHFEIAKTCLEHGVHTLIEKPISHTVEQANELIEIAKKNNLVLQIGHLERFNQVSLELNKSITKPLFIESHRLAPFKPRSTDINVVLDLMIHDIDLILSLVNSKIKSIQANGAPVLTDKFDIANARLTFENGCVANVTASRVSMKSERKLRIFQKKNYIHVDLNEKVLNVYQKGDKEIFPGIPEILIDKKSFPQRDALFEQNSHFVNCITNNKQPLVTGMDGKRALQTALEINQHLSQSEAQILEPA